MLVSYLLPLTSHLSPLTSNKMPYGVDKKENETGFLLNYCLNIWVCHEKSVTSHRIFGKSVSKSKKSKEVRNKNKLLNKEQNNEEVQL